MQTLHNDQRGLGHVILIVVIAAVLAVVGYTVWRALNKGGEAALTQVAQQAAAIECNKNIDDKDLCKFFTSWEASAQYRIVSTSDEAGETVTSTFEVDGDKSHVKMSGNPAYEVITIGDATYTKAGDTWWKQTLDSPEESDTEDYKVEFDEPTEEEGETAADQTTYEKLGKEACGDLQCFKYQILDPEASDITEYIWFDDKDYKLRKTRSESSGGVSEATFEYEGVSIGEPSPVKELGPDQYIAPGSSEPVTLPSGTDFNFNQ